MLDRNGKLVNIGEYYMFQPIELPNDQLTHFERSVPVDFKRDVVEMRFPKSYC